MRVKKGVVIGTAIGLFIFSIIGFFISSLVIENYCTNLVTTEEQNNTEHSRSHSSEITKSGAIVAPNSPEFEAKVKQDAAYQEQAKVSEWRKDFHCHGTRIELGVAWFTFCLFVATGGLWLITYLLARDSKEAGVTQSSNMKSSLDISKTAMVAANRAYVFMGSINPDPRNTRIDNNDPPRGEWRYRFQPIWQNGGNTPTRGMVTYADHTLQDKPIPPTFNFAHEAAPNGSCCIGPKTSVLGPNIPPTGISGGDMQDVHLGKKFLYIWGWARYWDVFEGTGSHITRYAFQVVVNGNPLNPGEDGKGVDFEFTMLWQNNCTDDDCPHK